MMAIEKTQTEILECLRALMSTNMPASPVPDDRPPYEHGSTDDPNLLSPRPYERKCGSMLSLDPPLPSPMKIGSVRRRHEEYTTITDSISIHKEGRGLRQGRSLSTEHPESDHSEDGAGSHDERESSVRPKRSTADKRADETDHSRLLEEEELADCELTDIPSDVDDVAVNLTEEELEPDLHTSLDDSKGIVFSVVNEQESPHPSPQRVQSPMSSSA
ncbi:unnamed protein product [Cylicostephanus goldi]|uniref:Uncharacterized protein n=1 Tax=Cylicostephanus goldi TaxID=71465 RepID=A0A3P7MNI1_CYLGO|nr:unnamed protein product [Cylicostephanus goldi]